MEKNLATPNTGLPSAEYRRDAPATVPIIDSQSLFAQTREIRILHKDRLYMLRITASDKLILTA